MNDKDLRYSYFFSCSLLSFLFFLSFSSSLCAMPLEAGMEIPDVISRWGGPREKIRYETLRAERWFYSEGREVYFKKGRVASWKAKGAQIEKIQSAKRLSSDEIAPPVTTASRDIKRRRGKESILSVSSFLSEVEKESGEESPEDSKKSSRKGKRR